MPQVTYPNQLVYGTFVGAENYVYQYTKESTVEHTGWVGGDRTSPYPFTRTIRSVTAVDIIDASQATAWYGPSGPYDTPWYRDARARARNLSYERLRNSFHNDIVANLGETLGEWRSSLEMIGKRSYDLADVVKRVGLTAQGKWKRLPQRKRKRSAKRVNGETSKWTHVLASTWLEASFGWIPLLTDLYDSYQVLSSDMRPQRLYATATIPYHGTIWNGRRNYSIHTGSVTIRQGAKFTVVNPNLALADQLGIINPLSVGWALTRLSFFVDWCFDVSTFLRSFTDYAGVELSDTYHTEWHREYWDHTHTDKAYNLGSAKQRFQTYERRVVRSLGLLSPLPNTAVAGNLGHSLRRATNAAAVLRVQFPKYWKQPR